MKQVAQRLFFTSSTVVCCIFASNLAQAQIAPDGTLPTSVNQVNNIFEITGGRQAGSNLFHSFREFSVPTGSEAFFKNSTNANSIVNIINRVTGGSISNIDGLIKENYGANLILINPNGINFGPNAQLNIGGSFLGSTANSIKFADGTEFSATNIQNSPLLTISVPVGLQFGQNPAAINIQGQGHNLSVESQIFSPFTRGDTTGLKVQPGQTLALVGGNITLDGGVLTAEGGRIELGSVSGNSFVNLAANPGQVWSLGYAGAPSFQDINMRSRSLADTSGVGSGSIQLQGRNITLQDGSAVLIQTQGIQSAENINVNASESLKLIGTTPDGQISTNIFTETIGGGKSGDINITTPRLVVQDGAVISAATYTSASSGNVSVNAAESLEVLGYSSVNPNRFSVISAATYGAGNAGTLTASTKRVTVTGGGNIASITAGTGSGGNVVVNASELVELVGFTPFVFAPSQITAGTGGPGSAGNVTINTKRLVVKDGGRVDASTLASGPAGSITINAKDSTQVSGTTPGSVNPSLIISSANIVDPSLRQLLRLPPYPSGASGDVTINTGKLSVTDGGLVTTSNQGSGISGDIKINAQSVFLDRGGGITSELGGSSRGRQPTFYSPFTVGGDIGGDINISAQELIVKNGTAISTATFTNVAGGNVNVDVSGLVQVDGFAAFNPNALSLIGSSTFGSGRSGDVNVSTGKLQVLNGARVGAGSFGSGSSGNSIINATESIQVIGREPSQSVGSLIGVSTLNVGNGGDLTINTPKLIVQDGGRVDSSTAASGSAGNVTINASKYVEVDGKSSLISAGANIESEIARQLFGLPPVPTGSSGDVTINTPKLRITNDGQVNARNQGTGNAGSVRINTNSTFLDKGGSITAATTSGEGGNIFLRTNSLAMRRDSQISAEAGGSSNGGNITITGFSPADFVVLLEGSKITANAFEGMGGNISINTQGLFVCPECQISASSQLGVDGQVEILTPNTSTNQEVLDLPQEITKPEEVVAQVCPADRKQGQSEFIITGRGGLPPRPSEVLSSDALLSVESDTSQAENISGGAIATKTNQTQQLPPIARGWYVNSKGAVILTAATPTPTPYASGLSSSSCHAN
ncbi:MAG: filamentous hemagglutinin N-terminal domain-containing protein [Fischerella sp. CENA71]|nr:filamentous hemagglutinin N-terminal domain-containing protein [Fischerella sp. CENA71]